MEDQLMSFHTTQATGSVSFVAVRLEQAIRGKVNSITSAYRIVSSPKCVSLSCGLHFSYSICPYLHIEAPSQ